MKPLVAIMSHSGANQIVQRHWPLYLRCGCDILGVGREDTECNWPAVGGQFLGAIRIGKESYATGDNHLTRMLALIEHFLSFKELTHLVVIEYDGIFLAPIPKLHADTFYGKVAGGNSPGFRGSMYLHTPWCMDRLAAGRILKYGRAMLKAGLNEQGFLDRWFGLMIDLYDLQWRDTGDGTYTQNTIEPAHYEDFKRALQSGIWYAHGVKTPEALRLVSHHWQPKADDGIQL